MQKLTDEEIIYKALKKYQNCCGIKKLPTLNQSRVIAVRSEMLQKVEKYVLLMNSSKTSESEKSTLCNKGKTLYQQYCFQIKVNSDIDTARLSRKMDELLRLMAMSEAKKVLSVREKQIAGNRIDLMLLFEEEKNVRAIINKPADIAINEILDKRKYTVVGEDVNAIFMTISGARYHRTDCPFCKGKSLIKTTLNKAENIGLTPCRCIALYSETSGYDEISEDTANEKQKDELKVNQSDINTIMMNVAKDKTYVTVFIDESVRENLWRNLDESIPEKQGVFSYIICTGRLTNENQISEKNIIDSNVMQAIEGKNSGSVAKEAILAVLFRLVVSGYHDNVLIYTDNQGAKDHWFQLEENHSLAKLFTSVMVCYVPREKNTKADQLARESMFTNISTKTVAKCLQKCRDYDEVKKELDYIKKYFPEPRKNIPNLVAELSAMAEAKKEESDGICIT